MNKFDYIIRSVYDHDNILCHIPCDELIEDDSVNKLEQYVTTYLKSNPLPDGEYTAIAYRIDSQTETGALRGFKINNGDIIFT